MPQKSWEQCAQKKRESVYHALPENWRLDASVLAALGEHRNAVNLPKTLLSEDEVVITESNAVAILENVHAGVWSAAAVTRAFCHRAAISHQLANCLTEIMFEAAMAHAEELDDFMAATGGLKGPLHGLPMSFMDRYRIAGVETAAGYIAWLGKPETEQTESLLVRQLKSLGAIPFCKTNMPLSMMLSETSNNIMNNSINPFVRTLSSGGAAGGEAVLLALRGSPFGWGTEIAGSGRIPACFNALYALKTSVGRISMKGVANNKPVSPVCSSTVAPICADVVSLTHILKILLCHTLSRQDALLLEMPWQDNRYREAQGNRHAPIFAALRCDRHVQTHPPVQRAMQLTLDALRAQGYQVIDWKPPPHEPAVTTLFQILGADGARGVRETLLKSGEPPVPTLRKWFYEQDTGSLPTADFWELCQKRLDYLEEYEAYWNSTADLTWQRRPVDGVILPVAPGAGAEDGKMEYFGYSAIVNLLDFVAGTFPVAFADQNLDRKVRHGMPFNDTDRKVLATYDPARFHGAPVGLQVMCRRFEEEKALGLLSTIADALSKKPQPAKSGARGH